VAASVLMWERGGWLLVTGSLLASATLHGGEAPLRAPTLTVEVEETVYAYEDRGGAGPLWTRSNHCIIRMGDTLFVSGTESLPTRAPWNNTRWFLLKHDGKTWSRIADGGETHEREPCPIVAFDDGRLFLSTNPNECGPQERDGTAHPQVLEFLPAKQGGRYSTLIPEWQRPFRAVGHTYRSFVSDAPNNEFILFHPDDHKVHWAFYSRDRWVAQGEFAYPYEAKYETPQTIRVSYPPMQIRNRAVHLCGKMNIIEPVGAWLKYKKEVLGRTWNYACRRMFYTWTDDITADEFHPWVELANWDEYAGWVIPCDLWLDADDRAHILWCEDTVHPGLRDAFFPEAKRRRAFAYAIVEDGKVVSRKAIEEWHEGEPGPVPNRNARFHETPAGRLYVLYNVADKETPDYVLENRIVEIDPRTGAVGPAVTVPLDVPLSDYYTAGVRGGSKPSLVIDVLGLHNPYPKERPVRYVRIRLQE